MKRGAFKPGDLLAAKMLKRFKGISQPKPARYVAAGPRELSRVGSGLLGWCILTSESLIRERGSLNSTQLQCVDTHFHQEEEKGLNKANKEINLRTEPSTEGLFVVLVLSVFFRITWHLSRLKCCPC